MERQNGEKRIGREDIVKFSIIVLMYNSSWLSVQLTLHSILRQKIRDSIEIIIADDGSKNNWTHEIENLFIENNYSKYIFSSATENVGTVKNIIRALEYTSGKYIKLIGAGDLLFDEYTLVNVYKVMEQIKVSCIFGNMCSYTLKDGYILNNGFTAPLCLKPFIKNDLKRIKRNIILEEDNISGASMFFEKNFLIEYMMRIDGKVKYAEDMIQVLILLDNQKISYIQEDVVIYEIGTGISTSSNGQARIRKDISNFWDYVYDNYNNKLLTEKKKRQEQFFLVRKFERYIKAPLLTLKCYKRKLFDMKMHCAYRSGSLGFLEQDAFISLMFLKRRI